MQGSLNGNKFGDDDSGQEDAVDSDIPFQTRALFTFGILVSEVLLALNISMVREGSIYLPSFSLYSPKREREIWWNIFLRSAKVLFFLSL